MAFPPGSPIFPEHVDLDKYVTEVGCIIESLDPKCEVHAPITLDDSSASVADWDEAHSFAFMDSVTQIGETKRLTWMSVL